MRIVIFCAFVSHSHFAILVHKYRKLPEIAQNLCLSELWTYESLNLAWMLFCNYIYCIGWLKHQLLVLSLLLFFVYAFIQDF